MRNQVYTSWDEVTGETREFTLPAANQAILDSVLDSLPDTDAARIIVDLADLWDAEEQRSEGQEVGTHRTHLTLSNGTHLLIALFGRQKRYAVAWHPDNQNAQHEAITALSDEEHPLSKEIETKHRLANAS